MLVDLGPHHPLDLSKAPIDLGRAPIDLGRALVGLGRALVDLGRALVDLGRTRPLDLARVVGPRVVGHNTAWRMGRLVVPDSEIQVAFP